MVHEVVFVLPHAQRTLKQNNSLICLAEPCMELASGEGMYLLVYFEANVEL